MAENKNQKKSWVSELNQSETNLKRKENFNKYSRYTFLSIIGLIIFLSLTYMLKIQSNNVSPTINISKIIDEPELTKPKEMPPHTHNNKQKINEFIVPLKLKKIDNPIKKEIMEDEKKTEENGRNGKYITYYENGNKWVELFFKNGKREGTQYSWHKNGNLKSELNYVNGKKQGYQKWWKKDGKMLNHKYYEDGE
jgi:hypothetical protein